MDITKLKVGQRVTTNGHNSFTIKGFAEGMKIVPDGWPIDEYGSAHNPNNINKIIDSHRLVRGK